MKMQGFFDVFKWILLKRTLSEVECVHPMSSRREMCSPSVNNMIYYKYSHGVNSYTLSRERTNVTLDFLFSLVFILFVELFVQICR